MKREQVIATLRAHEAELRDGGARHVALFGSVARGEERPNGDIDILIELDPQRPIDLFAYVALTQFLADLFPARVEVANRGGLKPLVRPAVERDAVYAFCRRRSKFRPLRRHRMQASSADDPKAKRLKTPVSEGIFAAHVLGQ